MWQIVGFTSTFFVTGTVYSQLSVRQGLKHGIQGSQIVDLTVDD